MEAVPVKLTDVDKEILVLIGRLLLENAAGHNVPDRTIVLSNSDADRLYFLLDQLVKNAEFSAKISFVSSVTFRSPAVITRLAEQYHSAVEGGRNRDESFEAYMERLGVKLGWRQRSVAPKGETYRPDVDPYFDQSLPPMDIREFMSLERGIFQACGLSETVIDLLMKYSKEHSGALIRWQKTHKKTLKIKPAIEAIGYFAQQTQEVLETNLVAIATCVSNASVLLTTRDWSAAGTFSLMISNACMIVEKKPPVRD